MSLLLDVLAQLGPGRHHNAIAFPVRPPREQPSIPQSNDGEGRTLHHPRTPGQRLTPETPKPRT